ncbi:alpha/beta hydrolase [Frankia sp. Ag45/Mut15]|uniref:Alpha/beta hydrolase n=1 Tax=Frankia umida TaxID=573489 RepID=A0ABT0JUG4_9ACTN|nr:alpha/beta hydrolase [Frankia umida]MCK9875188.1 alpha/beta hydrolase [Frankia umida]
MGIRLTGAKRSFSTPERTRARVEQLALRPTSYAPPRTLSQGTRLGVRQVAGTPVYTVAPPVHRVEHRVLYLHGGAYIHEIGPFQWMFIRRLALAAPAQVEVPIYPLAPQVTAERTVPAMTDLLAALVRSGHGPVTLMGDSAGGGLALAAAQQLRDRGDPQPARIVLISPWLDITVSEPRQREIDAQDRMLAVDGLVEAGRLYAGPLDPHDARVSPLLADLRGLAPIDVFTGTADILNTDAHRLAHRCDEVGQPITLHEADGMQHAYPLLPLIAEGRRARRDIARLVASRFS